MESTYTSFENEGSPLISKCKVNHKTSNVRSTRDDIVLFCIILFANILGPLQKEAQIPAINNINRDLNGSTQSMMITMILYMLVYGLSQLIFGGLNDIYGRRNILLSSLWIHVLSNICCAFSPNIVALNTFRVIHAIGSGASVVTIYAITRDVFEVERRTKILGVLGICRPVIVGLAPIFGGIINALFGWRCIFWIVSGISFGLSGIVYFKFEETITNNDVVNIHDINDYIIVCKRLLKERVFLGLILISSALYAGTFIIFDQFNKALTHAHGLNHFEMSTLSILIILVLIIGAIISIALATTDPFKILFYCLLQILLSSTALILPCIFSDSFSIYWTIIPLYIFILCDGILLPHLLSTALEPFNDCAGIASGLSGFIRFITAYIITFSLNLIPGSHINILHLGTSFTGIIAVIIFAFSLLNPFKFNKYSSLDICKICINLTTK